jgi:hypothetical protein
MSALESDDDGFLENININKMQTTRNYTTADFKELANTYEEQISEFIKGLKNYKASVSKNMLTVTYNATIPDVEGVVYFKQRFVTKNKIQYTITLAALASNTKMIAIADKIMDGIVVK